MRDCPLISSPLCPGEARVDCTIKMESAHVRPRTGFDESFSPTEVMNNDKRLPGGFESKTFPVRIKRMAFDSSGAGGSLLLETWRSSVATESFRADLGSLQVCGGSLLVGVKPVLCI